MQHEMQHEKELIAMSIQDEISAAVKSLGYIGKVQASEVSPGRYAVYVDGEYIGIYDTVRHTFVD